MFSFEKAAGELESKFPDDNGVKWFTGRLGFVVGSPDRLTEVFDPNNPNTAAIHLRILEQYQHMRDCPVLPGQKPYTHEARTAVLDFADAFARATELPAEVVTFNQVQVINDMYNDTDVRIAS